MKSFFAGVRAEFPLLIGVFPFGLIYGALAIKSGLSPSAAQMMSSVVYAGSAQFIAAQLVYDSAPEFIIVLTIAIVNLRHMLYSASVAPYTKHLPMRWKTLLAYLLTDEAYAVTIINYEKEGFGSTGHWFFLGAGLVLWITWQISSALGVFLGAALPFSLPLDFAVPITFIAMIMPVLKDKPMVAATISAGIVALLTYEIPFKLGLIMAAFVGILTGMYLENRK